MPPAGRPGPFRVISQPCCEPAGTVVLWTLAVASLVLVNVQLNCLPASAGKVTVNSQPDLPVCFEPSLPFSVLVYEPASSVGPKSTSPLPPVVLVMPSAGRPVPFSVSSHPASEPAGTVVLWALTVASFVLVKE